MSISSRRSHPLSHRTMPATPLTGPIGVAVLGTGFGEAVHIPALKHLNDVNIVVVVARRAERARAVASRHGIPNATTDWRDAITDPEVHAVVIATPPYLHHQMAITALEEGKHVLCEKPMARNLAESRDMVKLAATANVVAMINHEFRYLPIRARVKELIDEGYIGEPQSVAMNVFRSTLADPNDRPFGWLMEQDKAGGMLGASGSHYIDSLRWWLGEIHAVAGTTATMVRRRRLPDSSGMAGVDADDNFAFILKFANGALATVHFCATAPIDAGEEITISGSEGMLIVQGDGELFGARRRDIGLRELPIPDRLSPKLPEFSHSLTRPTLLLMRDWIEAIRTGAGATFAPSFADGAKVQEVIDGVIRSGVQGRWIDTSGNRWRTSRSL
ncbi:MAG TPA: Gfo/Idh/MocA family oxidoreductase [Thermomicrobiales bacterium]|nr:Gfo/Idh/MocA family oxidoreductase [Thermomicrobiales bacterium]